jgi:NarL family two-component system sensor histidine kinase LiaS
MSLGKYVVMDATISLRTSGPRNNWFSERLQHVSIGSFRWIILFLGIVVLGLFGIQVVTLRTGLQTVETALDYLQEVQTFGQQAALARVATAEFLAADSSDAYAEAEQAFDLMTSSMEQMMWLAPADHRYVLSNLEQASSDYRNAFRSYQQLSTSSEAAAPQQAIHQQLVVTGAAFEQQIRAVVQQSFGAANESVSALARLTLEQSLVLLLVLVVIFGSCFALVFTMTRHNAYALRQLGVAAGQIAQERYDTRIDVTGEANPNVVQLGMAINHLAQTLQGALRSESAAQQQNQVQLMKLARQERKTAVLEERQRIARELHDSVKQQLFSIILSTSAALNLLDHAPQHVRTYLEHIQQAGQQAQSEMTALVQELVPVSMQDKRLDEALYSYLSPLCDIHHLKLLWRVDGTNTLTLAQEHAVFRAVQEAVSNVVRHSGATVLRVSINFGLLTHVIVEDNGAGFVPDVIPATSTGLALMQTRLKQAGGHYDLQTGPQQGTRLTIQIDLRRAALVHS